MNSPHPEIERALRDFGSYEIPPTPPMRLPLLDSLRDLKSDRRRFASIDVLFIQHHLGPFIPRLESMFQDGLAPERCWFVDIPYSTNEVVRSWLEAQGCPSQQMCDPFDDPLAAYSEIQDARVSELINKIANRDTPQPLLVIDDGAYFARYLNRVKENDPSLLSAFDNCSVVEQTTRGHRYIFNHALGIVSECRLSVVSVARCRTKTEFEGPFIGAAVSQALIRRVGPERFSDIEDIAVIGYGTVGQATVRQILCKSPRATLDIVDIDRKARDQASSIQGCQGIPQLREYHEYELVVGCTGYNSFHLDQRRLLADGAILASGSSAAVEFNRAGFIDLADEFDDDELMVLHRNETLKKGIHADIHFQQEGEKVFYFLNAGFPVNFDGRIECLPAHIIQATHCLLYYASIQTLMQECPGVNTIDPEVDGWIFDNAVGELRHYRRAQNS
jgi:S-adenosylhomocysteine hydrolase